MEYWMQREDPDSLTGQMPLDLRLKTFIANIKSYLAYSFREMHPYLKEEVTWYLYEGPYLYHGPFIPLQEPSLEDVVEEI